MKDVGSRIPVTETYLQLGRVDIENGILLFEWLL